MGCIKSYKKINETFLLTSNMSENIMLVAFSSVIVLNMF